MTKYAYVGTYTQEERGKPHRKEGIYVYRRDAESGKLSLVSTVDSKENPSFLRLHPNKRFLYAVNELAEGEVSAFAIDPGTGRLTRINSQPTLGVHPCYISYDPAGRFAMISNYSSGSLAVFPIQADGQLAPMSGFVEHKGSGPNQGRQERAHAHSIAFDPSGQFVLAADLGIDRILVYTLDGEHGKLALHELPGAEMRPGSGPRHFVFHPNGKILYGANELDGTVTVCTWDSQKGRLTPVQHISTLPADFKGENTVADIHLDPAAKTLYVSNRGHNSLAVFRVNGDASLTLLEITSCGGNWPRNFAVDPDGKWLYVANQYSGNLVLFRLDPDTGRPIPTGDAYELPSPVCIELAEL